jgi:Mat/Ecp fimbriae major subunit
MFFKYLSLGILSNAIFCSSIFAEENLSTIVKWQATAVKTSKSSLLVNPTSRMLNFSYSPENESFNTVKSDFDLNVLIPVGVTDTVFKVKVLDNSLNRKIDDSVLNVGVEWNGSKLSKTNEVTLERVEKSNSNLINFTIESAEIENKKIKIKDLKDGTWNGDVSLAFTAYWK